MRVWSFLAVTIPLVLTPGASTAIVLRNSISGGIRAGVETAAGVNTGSVVYGVVSAFGLALALRRWPATWTILRAGGAAYLLWLARRSFRSALRPRRESAPAAADVQRRTLFRNLKEGFLTNLLNPSIASFYLIVMPQFVPRGASIASGVLLLTALHVTIALTWHLVWAAAGGTLSRLLAGGTPRRMLDIATGTALVILAIRLLQG